jgi:putative two-component system hydrogenase maturation factor HypX/HoxX
MLIVHSCPDCGAPAEETDRFCLPSTDGPIEHIALQCVRKHHFRMPVDMLSTLQPPTAPQYQEAAAEAPADMRTVEPQHRLRVLFLVSAHGGLSQAAQVALTDLGHEVTVAVVDSPEAMLAPVRAHDPDLIACPMLTTMIPHSIWSQYRCLIVHPGPLGDRGPSSIDWAIELDAPEWGVTVLEANGEFDAGRVWATRTFERRSTTKSSLYRHEVRAAAIDALVESVNRIARGESVPPLIDVAPVGQDRPLLRQQDRRIDWTHDTTDVVLRKVCAGDGRPGTMDTIGATEFHLFGAHREGSLRGRPGELIAQRDGAICRATTDGAVWISHLKQRTDADRKHLKLPAVAALSLAGATVSVPEIPVTLTAAPIGDTYREIAYREEAGVGYLHFDFYNGAMSTNQCRRLRDAYQYACSRDTGIHLNVIEAAADPAGESWRNLNAINDVVHDLVTTDSHCVIAAMGGDAAAGGIPFALAADRVVARAGIVLNPYYQHMGGLYGSEYWTYLLPRRVGDRMATQLTSAPFTPISAEHAAQISLIDESLDCSAETFAAQVRNRAEHLARHPQLQRLLDAKRCRRACDERTKPLEHYRQEELARSHECFFGTDRRYHVARTRFAYKYRSTRSVA